MKRSLFRIFLAVSVLILAAVQPLSAQQSPVTVRYAYQPGTALIVIARDIGLLEKEFGQSVTFEFSKFTTGPAIIEAFAGNRIDFGQTGDQPALQARANDIDINAIGVYASTSTGNGLLVTPESGIKTLADLKGKKVGVTIGSVGHQLLYIYLKTANLKPGDIQQVNLAPGDILTSLTARHIDAAVTWEPYLTMAQAREVAILLTDATGYKLNVNTINASATFLKNNRGIAVRLLKVLDQAGKWIRENQDQAIKLVAQDTGFNEEVHRPSISKLNYDVRLTPEAVASIRETAAFLQENRIVRRFVNADDLVDTSYLEAAGLQ